MQKAEPPSHELGAEQVAHAHPHARQVRPVLGPRLPVCDLGLTRLRETRGCVYAVNGELSQAFIYLRYQVN